MRFVLEEERKAKPLEQHEVLFLDCWYGLTHNQSLDSYRVKCLNARTIVRELCEELEIGRLDQPEFQGICEETLATLERDTVVPLSFSKGYAALKPLIATPPQLSGGSKKDKEDAENKTRLRDLRFAASDLSAALEDRYFRTVCNRLQDALDNKDVANIAQLTDAVLSDLVAQGWELSELFRWHWKFLADDGRTFSENLAFMLKQLKRPEEEFAVTLRLSGGKNVREITEFGHFALSPKSGIVAEQDYQKRFVEEDDYTVFASGRFLSVDFLSAAICAREKIEPLLDALRFEFEPRLLSIDRNAMVVRAGDNRKMLVQVVNPVPNPVDPTDSEDFSKFSGKLSAVLRSPRLDANSKNRIETAFRRYRFGRDSDSYADKFLHWWMGLEALSSSGGPKIGRTVTCNVSHAMLTGYMFRILRDMLITLKYLKIEWHDDYKAPTQAETVADLSVPGLVKLLLDDALAKQLWNSLSDRPYIVARGEQVTEWVAKPDKAALQLKAHLQRLQWHIDRLYRIRCCFVHGSPVRFRLALYSANLEYYLKQTLTFALNALSEHQHVGDLGSLFQRAEVMWKRQIEALEDNASANQQTINEAIYASVVTQD